MSVRMHAFSDCNDAMNRPSTRNAPVRNVYVRYHLIKQRDRSAFHDSYGKRHAIDENVDSAR
jgi:hypothetical protein